MNYTTSFRNSVLKKILPPSNLCPAGRDICRWVIMNLSKLKDKNSMASYEYCKQIVVESSKTIKAKIILGQSRTAKLYFNY